MIDSTLQVNSPVSCFRDVVHFYFYTKGTTDKHWDGADGHYS